LPLFSGYGFEAVLHTEMRGGKTDLGLTLTITAMEVPDLDVYNGLLSEEWHRRLLGGTGQMVSCGCDIPAT
jgi:hypothetical protein